LNLALSSFYSTTVFTGTSWNKKIEFPSWTMIDKHGISSSIHTLQRESKEEQTVQLMQNAASKTTMETRDLPVQDMKPTKARHFRGPLAVAKFFVDRFASFTTQRDPPSPAKTQHARLVTIKVSHYCEKGRWALDLVEADNESPIYYTEDPHPPAFASFASVCASQDTGSITPLVILDPPTKIDAPECIAKSDVLLRRFCPFLYPKGIEQEVKAMEDMLGERLGPTVRVYCYHYMLQPKYHNALIELCAGETTTVEHFLFEKMFNKGIEKGMRNAMGIDEDSAALSEKTIQDIFNEMSDRLQQNGGKYLMDTKTQSHGFTAVDLTFAALASPLIRPPELSNFTCSDEDLPPNVLAFADKLKETAAGKHVLEIYSTHRFTDKDSTVVTIKGVKRERTPWPELSLMAAVLVAVSAVIYTGVRNA
jgi:glutathione S-transferase